MCVSIQTLDNTITHGFVLPHSNSFLPSVERCGLIGILVPMDERDTRVYCLKTRAVWEELNIETGGR